MNFFSLESAVRLIAVVLGTSVALAITVFVCTLVFFFITWMIREFKRR